MTTARVTAGVPTGGQFAATSHAEPDLALDADDAPGPEVWTREGLAESVGFRRADSLYNRAGQSFGAAMALAVQEESDARSGYLPADARVVDNAETHYDGAVLHPDGTRVTATVLSRRVDGVTAGTAGESWSAVQFIRDDKGQIHVAEPNDVTVDENPAAWEPTDGSGNYQRADRNGHILRAFRGEGDLPATWSISDTDGRTKFTGTADTGDDAQNEVVTMSDQLAAAQTRVATERHRAAEAPAVRHDVLREMLRGVDPDSIAPPF